MIGHVVDGHEIVRSLGVGGMGEVYLARSRDGALRAFKIVRSDRGGEPQAAGRFRREVHALRRLTHPGIVRMLDAGPMENGELYLAMEYVAGPDLQGAVDRAGPFSVADGLRILAQLSAALAYAHGEGIVHRDLKPANVILADGDPGQAKIIDFGLAKIAADEGLTRLTDDEQVLGSPLYWAPEQSESASVGSGADLYALGGVAYFILTGVPLFRARAAVAMVYAHLHEIPESLASRCPTVEFPDGLDELLAACVAKDPAQRPTADELLIRLEQQLAVTPSSARAGRPPRLFTKSNTSDMEQAVTSQIRQTVVELAEILGRPIDEIDRIQNEVSELELELAMLDSEVDAAPDPVVEHRHEEVESMIDKLHRELSASFRALVDLVIADRATAPPDAATLYEELDALFERYRNL